MLIYRHVEIPLLLKQLLIFLLDAQRSSDGGCTWQVHPNHHHVNLFLWQLSFCTRDESGITIVHKKLLCSRLMSTVAFCDRVLHGDSL